MGDPEVPTDEDATDEPPFNDVDDPDDDIDDVDPADGEDDADEESEPAGRGRSGDHAFGQGGDPGRSGRDH